MDILDTPKATKERLMDMTISANGDRMRIVGVGNSNADGMIYLHLASTTRFHRQKNGNCPVQIADWFPASLLPISS